MALTKVSRDLLNTGIDDNSTSTAITIDSGQRVGLGTTSPTSTFRASIKGDYSSVIGGIEFDSGGGDKFTIGHASATSPSGTLNVVGAGNMIFKTNNSEVGRFDSSGNLLQGINTIPTGVQSSRQLISSSTTGAEVIAYREDNAVVSSDFIGAFLIGHDDNSGTEDHFIGMWGEASSANGNMNLKFAAGKDTYETGGTHMMISSAGNVGIGTNSPSATGWGSANPVLQLSGSQPLLSLKDTDTGEFQIANTNQQLYFWDSAASSTRMVINSNSLLVGKTADNNTTAGHRFTASGFTAHVIANDYPLLLNRLSSDGPLLTLRKDSSTVGQINVRSGDMVIGTGDTGLQFYDVGNAIFPLSASGNTNRDGAIDLGEASNRFRNLHLGNQIIGGFGAQTTSGTTNWNDSTNARSGMGMTLLLGTHTNGPGVSGYFHAMSLEYTSKNGTGNMTQLAIGYTNNRFFALSLFKLMVIVGGAINEILIR